MSDVLGEYKDDAISAIDGLKADGVTTPDDIIDIALGNKAHPGEAGAKLRRTYNNATRISKDTRAVISALSDLIGTNDSESIDENLVLLDEFTAALAPFTNDKRNAQAIDASVLHHDALTPEQHRLNAAMHKAMAAGLTVELRQVIHEVFTDKPKDASNE